MRIQMRTLTYWLSLFLIFTIPWENIVNIGSLGRISRVIGLLVAGLWIITVLVRGKVRKPNLFHLAVYLFIIWNMVTIFWSVDTDRTISRIQTYFQLFVLVLLLWDLYSEPSALEAGLQAYVLGAYVSIINILSNYNQGTTFYYDRFSASGFNPNDLAFILSLGMPAAWYLAVTIKSGKLGNWLKIIYFLYLPFAAYAIFLTVSRAAIISIAFTLLFVLISLPRFRTSVQILIIAGLVISVFAVKSYIPESSVYILQKKQVTLNQRDVIWTTGLSILSEHTLLGIGSNAFGAANKENGEVAHNIFVAVITETGLIGFLLLMLILAVVGYHLLPLPRLEMAFWLATLFILLLGAFTHNLEARKQSWLFLSFLVAHGTFFRNRAGKDSVAAEPTAEATLALNHA